jgi:hypothetical protein
MIAKLEEIGQIRQIFDGEWLSQALLAPKPHQEHVFNIADYIWRLCVNYIMLNRVTKIISYPIPRCDFAVGITLGDSKFRWLLDAPQGFHQIAVNLASQEKLAFAEPFTRKWMYNVMPFGPVNGPVTFVIFIYDCKADWDELAEKRGLTLGSGTGSVIIIDDIHGSGDTWENALAYLECQLTVCLHRRLSLNLKKCHLFNKRFEFVGHDIAEDGNHPAESKFDLVRRWPNPTIIRDIAGLLGFCVFYSCYIPFMEVKCRNLRKLCTLEYETKVSSRCGLLSAKTSGLSSRISSFPTLAALNMTHRNASTSRPTLQTSAWATWAVSQITIPILSSPCFARCRVVNASFSKILAMSAHPHVSAPFAWALETE